MPADPVRSGDTRAWLIKSLKDLRRAEDALASDTPDTEDALFHSQQAVEKALKAYLVWHDQTFRKTHDLVELSGLCTSVDSGVTEVLHGLAPLTRYAWEFRYPGDSPEPSLEDARSWLGKAKDVVKGILEALPGETHP